MGPERQDKYVRYDWNLTVTQVVTTGLFDEDIPLNQPTHAQRERVARVLRAIWAVGVEAAAHSEFVVWPATAGAGRALVCWQRGGVAAG